LYTWTPMTLGNLVKAAGFKVVKANAIRHCWVGDYIKEATNADLKAYHEKCNEHALRTNNYQVRVVAKKTD